MNQIFKVVGKSAVTEVPSKKEAGAVLKKCVYHLQSLDGDEVLATAFDEKATLQVAPGDVVAAGLWLKVREYDGNKYQDCTVGRMAVLQSKLQF